jgi:hypothetical protein
VAINARASAVKIAQKSIAKFRSIRKEAVDMNSK